MALIAFFILLYLYMKKNNALKKAQEKNDLKEDVEVVDGVRYNTEKDTKADVKFVKGDVILQAQTPYVVSKDGPVLPGKYVMICAAEGVDEFKLRAHGFVKTYTSGSEIVFAEGEEIEATNANVILK